MRSPVRATAGWLAGRIALFFVIVATLVVFDAYRDESSMLAAHLNGLIPDAGLVQRLERGRAEMAVYARARSVQAIQRLNVAESQSAAALDQRIVGLQAEIARRMGERRSSTRRTLALLAGRGFEDDIRRELDIQLLSAERDALRSLRSQLAARRDSVRRASEDFERKRQRILKSYAAFAAKQAELERFEREYFIRVRIPGTAAWARADELRRERDRLLEESSLAAGEFRAARARRDVVLTTHRVATEVFESTSWTALQALDELVASKREGLEAAERQVERIRRSARTVFFNALVILVLVTLAPIGIKAFWYWVVAPAATRRPPIRLVPQVASRDAPKGDRDVAPARAKVSAVSLEVTLGDAEEVLVHPDYLQSSSDRSRKDTKWLLDWQYPVTSLAARMVALTRIRGPAGESLVISSKRDPFSEVGEIPLPEGTALVLQPRSLVGVVQSAERPVRIESRWRIFSLGAWITFQFRYLVFLGPGRLLVQGCRGVRIEEAGRGRSIDQAATIGFSANLDYASRRSETFGAYLMGMRGLFNDNFSGGPGFYVYEEMPYFGRKSGITGRGLQGLTDALLKVFGI